MKNIVIAGGVGKDAVIRNAGDKQVTGWSVGVKDGWGQNEKTLWFDCSWWGQRGVKVADYIKKGGKITVCGELSTREHNGVTYQTIDVSDVTLQGSPASDNQGQSHGSGYGGGGSGSYGGGGSANSGGGHGIDDSEIPF